MSFRRRALFLAGLFVAVSCSDAGNPLDPDGPKPPTQPEEVLASLTCTVSVGSPGMECAPATPSTGAASGIYFGGVNGDLVELTKIGHNVDADSMWFDVTLENFIHQALGTEDGVTPHAEGIRVFFNSGPSMVTAGNVDVVPTGRAFITAPNQAYYQYPGLLLDSAVSAPVTWKFKATDGNDQPTPFVAGGRFVFTVVISAKVQFPDGWLTISPDSAVLEVGDLDSLTARIRNPVGRYPQGPPKDSAIWTSSDPSVVTVTAVSDTMSEITAVGEGTAWVRAVSSQVSVRHDSVMVTVNNKPVVVQDSVDALSNVTDSLPAPRLQNRVTGGGGTVVPDTVPTFAGGEAIILPGGGLVYRAPAGFSGKDTVTYQVRDDDWTVNGKVVVNVLPSNYWYVRANATGDGRDRSPFGTIAAAQAAAGAADSIFVLTPADGSSAIDGAAVLKNGQALIGQGVAFDIKHALNADSITVLRGTGAAPGLTRTTAGATVTLAQNNVIRGLGIDADAGAAIEGTGFGTLFIRETDVAPTGPALNLSTGTVDAVFGTLSALNSATSGITLTGVNGSVTAAAGAISIAGAGGTAVSVSGGVNLSYPGTVTQGTNNALLVVGTHTGTLAFSGALQATAGAGVQLSGANGSYTFAGAVTLNGGDAGLDVISSNGVIDFASAAITNPSGGPAVNVSGGTPALLYRGSITHNTGRAVLIDGITADSVVLRAAITSGTVASPTGLGILVQNVSGGRVALDSTKSLFTGAAPAVTLTGNTGGLVRFGGGMDITTTTGAGFAAAGADSVVVTGVNTVSTGTGIPVSLTGVSTGTTGVSFASVTSTAGAANGIVLNGITGTGFQAAGGTLSGTTGPAVQLTNTSALDSVSLRGMTLSRGAGTGGVVSGTTFGKLHVLNTSVTATGGPSALVLATGTLSGSFGTLSANSSTASGVSLTSVGGTLNATGGSINTSAAAAFLLSGGSVGGTVAAAVAQATAAQPLLSVTGGHTGALTFAGNVTATNGTGLQFTDADGTYNFTGSTSLAGGDAGIDIASASSGAVNVTPAGANSAAITSPTGTAVSIVGGSADLTFNGNVTQANNASLLSVTGGHSGDVAFPAGTVSATNGNGLQFDNADGTYDFDGTVTLNGGDAGIDITNGSGGTFSFPATANIVSPGTGNLVSILNSAPTFTYAGAFTKANNNVTGILLSNNTGGSITFNGSGVTKSISSGNAAAVNLSSNTGTSITFGGGSLVLTSGSGAGLTATGGGTLEVTGSNNTVASTAGGTPVNIQNTTIGGNNVTFRSVNKSTGSGYGIRLENTGTSGGLKVTGDGSSANSGGTITQSGATVADSAAVTLTNTGNVALQFMRFSITTGSGSSGIVADGLNGTNLVQKSTVDFNNVAPDAVPLNPAYGARFVQNTNATITLDGVTMQNKLDGTTAGSLSAGGSATVNFNVIDSNTGDSFGSTLQGLFGSGWVISSGDTGGSTATVNATVSDTRFQNAAANGTNNLELGGNAASTLNYKIKNNVFSGVANASFIAGIINVQTFDTAVMGGTMAMDSITGNTISNSGTSSAVTDLGYVGIRVALQNTGGAATHRVVIHNNQITDLWRQGVLLSTRGLATGHIKVVNNSIGTLGAPVGQSGRRGLETDLQDNSVMNLEATGNTFTATSTVDTRAAMGIRVGTNSGSATLNATVLSNTMQSTAAGNNGRFSAESGSVGTGTLCLDLRSNTLDGATRLFTLAQNGGTYRVEGAGTGAVSNAAIQAANTTGTGNVTGSVSFNNSANCTQPPI